MVVNDVQEVIDGYNSPLDPEASATAIILAAGHGKRIKSQRSKMLHKIWGKTTVERVSTAAASGLDEANICIVVGIKASSVIRTLGRHEQQQYVYQETQRGTGHAVQVALRELPDFVRNQEIYIFPGDIGLLRTKTVRNFRQSFQNSGADMMVLTGLYEGDPDENYYGRIVRVPEDEFDREHNPDAGKVIQIMESKDIQALEDDQEFSVQLNGHTYTYVKDELLGIREFNTGVFAFRGEALFQHIDSLDANNVQGELYATDLIKIFNDAGLTVQATPAEETRNVLGFNNKSVLKQMNSIYKREAYDKLKDIIQFRDPDDFFLNDETVEFLLNMDKDGETPDIRIGKSVYVNGNIEFAPGVRIMDNCHITGNIKFGRNVLIHKGVELSTYDHQTLEIGDNSVIYQDNIVKGNTTIGERCRIESGVNITGSDKYPTRIGDRVMIKGTSYIFGSLIEDNTWIEHCVLKAKRVYCHYDREGNVAPIRYVIPPPEGIDDVESMGDDREEYTWPPSDSPK